MTNTEKQSQGISLFCDLHGHNKQLDTFIYGCNKAPNEGLLSWTKTRLFPKIFASAEPIFNYQNCVFSQEKIKYNTARVVVWNEFKVTNSFTLETSMYGKRETQDLEKRKKVEEIKQLEILDFDSIGVSLLTTIKNYMILEKQLESESRKTGGWLTKRKLDEVTGENARQKHENALLKNKMKQTSTLKATQVEESVVKIKVEKGSNRTLLPDSNKKIILNPKQIVKPEEKKVVANKVNSQKVAPENDDLLDQLETEFIINWKDLFTDNEMETAIIESKKPIEKKPVKPKGKVKQPPIPAESDSEPSVDNFDEEELIQRFEVAVSDDEMEILLPKMTEVKEKKKYFHSREYKNKSSTQNLEGKEILKPKEYKTIVDTIVGVHKETQKLSKRFSLLTAQIQAKIL